jgi:hypothetical protein
MRHLLKIKFVDSRVNTHVLASTSVPFTLTTVQVLNLALTNTKQITVRGARRKGEIKRRAPKNLKREKMPGGKNKMDG